MTTTLVTCKDCEVEFDLDTDHLHWANLAEAWLCESCYENDTQYASTVFLFGPSSFGSTHGDGPFRCYVTEDVSMTMWGDEPNLDFKRTYHPTDGWRGYHVTKIDGWVEVGLDGWTTGGWGDPTAERKQPFNNWIEEMTEEDGIVPPVDVAVALDPTSNVFSTAVTVYVEDGNREAFLEWLNGGFAELEEALS